MAAARRGSAGWTSAEIGLVVAFVAVLALYFHGVTPAAAPRPASPPAGVQVFANLSRAHVLGHVDYPQVPPVGGAHNPQWLTCGIYTSPAPNENAVHSMEHGAVWITYRPNLPAPQIAALRDAVRGRPYTLLAPYPDLPAPVVVSAWGVQLRLPAASDPRLAQFIALYRDGPQTPERGAPCAGGIGQPSG